MKYIIKTPGVVCNTGGTGYWTKEKRAVGIKDIQVVSASEEMESCDILVRFKRKDWDIEKHGLIYTDRTWLAEFRKVCDSLGLPGRDVDYTEQGMQGNDYVSLEAGKKFLKAWTKVTGKEVEAGYDEGINVYLF